MIGSLARALEGRSPRERGLLAALVLGVLPLGFAGLVALPLIEARQAAQADLDAALAERGWYLAQQARIAALPRPSDAPAGALPVSAAPVGLGGIEAALVEAGLRGAVTSLANAPEGGVALALAGVDFVPLMRWIETAPGAAGYHLAALRLLRAGPGLLDAEIRLAPARP